MNFKTLAIIILFLLVSGSAFAGTSTPIGIVKTISGEVKVKRGNDLLPVHKGFEIFQNDYISTGKAGAVGIIFSDDTVVSLGPDTGLAIDEFVFAPRESKLSMILRLLKGTASYLSGIIGKQSPESVKFETPEATIGARGTKFLVKVD